MPTNHDVGEDPLEAAAKRIGNDKPCITDAIKNYCTCMAANGLSSDERQRPPELGDLLAIARIVLRQINAVMLPAVEEWALAHPQGDDESALDRIEKLTRYNAAYLLAKQCRTADTKLTKVLGRQFLLAADCWDAVRAASQAELTRQRYASALTSTFLDGWGAALTGLDAITETGQDTGQVAGLSELVWATDFQGALEVRRAARNEEVRARRERMQTAGDEAEQLREALLAEDPEAMEEEHGGEEEEERIVEVGVATGPTAV